MPLTSDWLSLPSVYLLTGLNCPFSSPVGFHYVRKQTPTHNYTSQIQIQRFEKKWKKVNSQKQSQRTNKCASMTKRVCIMQTIMKCEQKLKHSKYSAMWHFNHCHSFRHVCWFVSLFSEDRACSRLLQEYRGSFERVWLSEGERLVSCVCVERLDKNRQLAVSLAVTQLFCWTLLT